MGGKNKVPMMALKQCLEELGFTRVLTYIQSGNVILESDQDPARVRIMVEEALPKHFKLDSKLVKVLVLTHNQLHNIIATKPKGFGDQPDTHHSDVIFLIDLDAGEAMSAFSPRAGVDVVWPGEGVIYSQRLSSQRTKSRLNKIVGTKPYQSMTIRNWNTTTKLLQLLEERGK